MLNDSPVSWCLKRQPTITFSLTEVEYIALKLATKEATWLQLLLTKLNLLQPDQQYALINISEENIFVQAIQ